MSNIRIPVTDCDVPAYTPGVKKPLKPLRSAITVSDSMLRRYLAEGRVLSAGMDYAPGDFSRFACVRIVARIKLTDTMQSLDVITATAGNYHRGNEFQQFCMSAVPQLLTIWSEMTDIPVQEKGRCYAGPVTWDVDRA